MGNKGHFFPLLPLMVVSGGWRGVDPIPLFHPLKATSCTSWQKDGCVCGFAQILFFLPPFPTFLFVPLFSPKKLKMGREDWYVAPRNGDLPQEHKSFSSLSPSCLSVRWRGALIN